MFFIFFQGSHHKVEEGLNIKVLCHTSFSTIVFSFVLKIIHRASFLLYCIGAT